MATLPDDAVLEIFSWLPAKAIVKFKSTSKFLFAASSTETYLPLKQSQNSLLKDDSCFFLQPDAPQRYNAITEFHSFPSEKATSGVSSNFLSFLQHYSACRIIGSSNGLVIGRSTKQNKEVELFVCNPVTESWLPIPVPCCVNECPDVDINIVFECTNESFMLFLFEASSDWSSLSYDVNFYSQKKSTWKTMEKIFFSGSRAMEFDMHVYHNNAFHFISNCFPSLTKKSPYFRPYIMAYNIEDGESVMLRVPKEARRGSHDLTCKMGIYKWGKAQHFDESICLVRLRKHVFTVWVLIDYDRHRWMKVLKVRVKAMGITEEDPVMITGFTVMNGDRLVFATKKKIYSYGLSYKNFMMLEEIREHQFKNHHSVYFTSYSNTLRPSGDSATSLPLMML